MTTFGQVINTPQIASDYGLPLPGWVNLEDPQNKELIDTYNEVADRGEASAMVLAGELNADLVIIDDAQARKFAKRIGLRVTGSLGILLLAKQQRVITQLRPYIDKIQQTNFRISQKILNEALTEVGE